METEEFLNKLRSKLKTNISLRWSFADNKKDIAVVEALEGLLDILNEIAKEEK